MLALRTLRPPIPQRHLQRRPLIPPLLLLQRIAPPIQRLLRLLSRLGIPQVGEYPLVVLAEVFVQEARGQDSVDGFDVAAAEEGGAGVEGGLEGVCVVGTRCVS